MHAAGDHGPPFFTHVLHDVPQKARFCIGK
jgi:hypothetical protein